ncbi:aminotransferase class I/II-fold pyridoxal phosphate-dependent enzyme [Desertibaculum subflavum]|uniref:aminotransferase class I/II-fold pyridoxal phosphate-dependent enzyme n=1 Tax=Desertibaculum subflavum TaxID=2268458 RepID=UPI000E667BEC
MPEIVRMSTEELAGFRQRLQTEYDAFRAQGLRLDMTRGKPAPEQLDLATALLGSPGNDWRAADGSDVRNYFGDLRGLPETRAIFADMLGVPVERILIGGNSSLALMHDSIVYALLHGVPGGRGPWSQQGEIAFLCPVPGYDRHFGLCEGYGIRMIPVPLTGRGPDMAVVERLVAQDASIKGIWCVPKYSNPTGEIYAPEVVERLAAMRAAAPDFRIFWDNAYAAHHLTATRHEVANIAQACARAGHPDRVFIFASTSKVTFAGSGLALFAASRNNLDWFMTHMGRRTIGADKVNQLRHARLLRDGAGLLAHMEQHRALLAPKFAAVQQVLQARLGGTGLATWTKPEGGYFVSLDVQDGLAKRVVQLATQAGIAMVPAGRTFPYGQDPRDRNIRLAPSFPSVEEVRQAVEGIALSVLLAGTEAAEQQRAA